MPWEFDALTPAEFELRRRGYERHTRVRLYHHAVAAAWALMPWMKRPKQAHELLGWPKDWWQRAWRTSSSRPPR